MVRRLVQLTLVALCCVFVAACLRWPVIEWMPDYRSEQGVPYKVSEDEIRAKLCYGSKGAAEAKLRRKARRKGFDDAVFIDCVGGYAGLHCFQQWKCTGFGAHRMGDGGE